MEHTRIRQMYVEDRPYERCLIQGPEALSDAELLAVLLRSGTRGVSSLELGQRLLQICPQHPGLTGLCHLSAEELQKEPGIGKVKAIQILCVSELSRRLAQARVPRRASFSDAQQVATYYMETLRHREQESIFCMMLDIRNRLLCEMEITKGTVSASLISPREVFLQAIQHHAVQIVLVHNHPSGDATPSAADRHTTREIAQAGALLQIPLVDHLIIGDHCYTSLRDREPQLFDTGP